jgi:hypothetical protein
VVQKNSLFDDPTAQIEDLTVVIKHQIDSVRKEVEVINKPEAKVYLTFALFKFKGFFIVPKEQAISNSLGFDITLPKFATSLHYKTIFHKSHQ